MRVSVLVDNRNNGQYSSEHGLSLLIEVDNFRLLFDTGQTGLFIDNARSMNVDLHDIDYVILSHGHYDHVGGFKRFLEEYHFDKTVYVARSFLDKKYKKVDEEFVYNGITFPDDIYPFTFIGKEHQISKNIKLYGQVLGTNDFEEIQPRFYLKKDGFVKDMFMDELFLTVNTPKGLVVFGGCSHVGIVNIIRHIENIAQKKVYAFVGGTHLSKANGERIARTKEELKDVLLYSMHCSKESNYFTGSVIEFPDMMSNCGMEVMSNEKKAMYQALTDKDYKDGDKN